MSAHVPAFNEIAKKLPDDLSEDTYNLLRRKYFYDYVAPKVEKGKSVEGTYTEFLKRTERNRSPLLGIAAHAGLAVASGIKGVTQPVTGLFRGESAISPRARKSGDQNWGENPIGTFGRWLEEAQASLYKTAARHSHTGEAGAKSSTISMEFAGAGVAFAGGEELMNLAPMRELTSTLAMGTKNPALAIRMMKGGVSMAAYEAASETHGDRMIAGLKGAGFGVGGELVLGGMARTLYKLLAKNPSADELLTKMMTPGEKSDFGAELVVGQDFVQQAKVAKMEGRPSMVRSDPTVRGVMLHVSDARGMETMIPVQPQAEGKALESLQQLLNNGGELIDVVHHPDHVGAVNRFLQMAQEMNVGKYETERVVRTAEQQAPQVAKEFRDRGTPATVKDGSTVVVETPQKGRPNEAQIAKRLDTLKDAEEQPYSKGSKDQIRRQVMALWDPKVPESHKVHISQQVANHGIDDIIPERWRVPKEVEEAKTPEVDTSPTSKTEEEEMLARLKEAGLSEAELNRLEEVTQKSKMVGVENPGVLEEAIRKGEIEPKFAARTVPIPAHERFVIKMTPSGPRAFETVVKERPSKVTIAVGKEVAPDIIGDATALVHNADYRQYLERLGINTKDLPKIDKPTMVHTDLTKHDIYHEGLHLSLDHGVASNRLPAMMGRFIKTASQVATGLGRLSAYETMDSIGKMEEAFVHAATEIRTGNARALAVLGNWDTNVRTVTQMVRETSLNMLEHIKALPDTYQRRMLQWKLQHLVSLTDENVSARLLEDADRIHGTAHYDWDSGTIVFTEPATGEQFHIEGTVKDLHDAIFYPRMQAEVMYPNHSNWAELRGIRGPITPEGGGPRYSTSTMGNSYPDNSKWTWRGWKAVSGAFKPMLHWVADLDTKLNASLSASGKKVPIYDAVKDVDDAAAHGAQWMDDMHVTAGELLKGNSKKLYDYTEALMVTADKRPIVAQKLKLTESDLKTVGKLEEYLKKVRDDTGIPVWNYLRDELPRLRGAGYRTEAVYGYGIKDPKDMSTFHRLISEGALDPKDSHLGRFVDLMLREGYKKKYIGQPLQKLEALLRKSGDQMGVAKWPLDNYVKYMKGYPDVTMQIMRRTVSDFQKVLAEKFTAINKHLPEKLRILPEEFSYPGAAINKVMLLSYVSGLGLRPAIAVRDAMQVLMTTLPVVGPKRFAQGVERLFNGGWEQALNDGALLARSNPGELYGDIFFEVPPGQGGVLDKATKLSNKLLSPSRTGHNVGRSITYLAEYDNALGLVRGMRRGTTTADRLLSDSALWFADKPAQERYLRMAVDKGVPETEVARRIALETVDNTQWPYRRGTQPTLLRTGLGRIFGQYGMWPLNYMDFLGRLGKKYATNPRQAAKTTATWLATNFAAVSAMSAMGADAEKWFFVSPAGFGGSPHAQLVQDLFKSPEETQEGRDARKRVLEYPMQFVPAGNEMQQIMRAVKDMDMGNEHDALLRILGFKPEAPPSGTVKPVKEETSSPSDLEKWLQYEAGERKQRP